MNKIILLLAALMVAIPSGFTQCNPQDHDWMGASFGVSPDPNLGESFATGMVGMPYSDVVYVLCPSSAGAIIPELSAVMIDSISLDSITLFNGFSEVLLSTVGLNLECNNNGDSPNPCMFLPGNAYCGDIYGTPTVAGEFPMKIYVTVFFNFFGPQSAPYAFENYTLTILGFNTVDEYSFQGITLLQNQPNPADNYTAIPFYLNVIQDMTLTISNLTGKEILHTEVKGKIGNNVYQLETSTFEPGVYFYSLRSADKTYTRKMTIQR